MLDDILALAAALYMFIKLNPLPQQRYPRTLPDLLTAGAELLTRHQPDDLPVLHNTRTSQQVTHVEFRVLEVLGFELAALTPAAWVEVFSRRFPLWEQQLLLQQLRWFCSQSGRRRSLVCLGNAVVTDGELMPAPSHDSPRLG